MKNFVEQVVEFNQVAGTTGESFDPRKTALYIGLVLEEVGELLAPVGRNYSTDALLETAEALDQLGTRFKKGDFDAAVAAMSDSDREEVLDACVDISVVSIGGGIAVGADVAGACNEVAENNLSKFPVIDGVRTALKDENGKVKKPAGYKPPELARFLR